MDSITLRLQADTIESLEEEANEHGVSRSEYIRDLIRSRDEYKRLREQYEALREEHERLQTEHEQEIERLEARHQEEIEDLEAEHKAKIEDLEGEINHLQNQIDRLQRTNLKILEHRDENTDLQVYVDERREWEQANWFTRQKWKLFGKD